MSTTTPAQAAAELGTTLSSLGCLRILRVGHGDNYLTVKAEETSSVWRQVLSVFLQQNLGFKVFAGIRFEAGPNGELNSYWFLQFRGTQTVEMCDRVGNAMLRARVAVVGVTPREVPSHVPSTSGGPPEQTQVRARPVDALDKSRVSLQWAQIQQEAERSPRPDRSGTNWARARGAVPVGEYGDEDPRVRERVPI